jgi:S-formylglutathione hydrolase FrmB
MFAALAEVGADAPIVAFPDGGDSSYWHDRADGHWGQYVVNEVIPHVLRETDADPKRVAIGGISMGGFGAFDIARLYPERFCAAGGHSPALWATPEETAEGAFDDAEDFARHNVVNGGSNFADQRVWIDAGTDDPFLPGDDAFIDSLESYGADVTSKRWAGGHDSEYWNAHWDDYFGFYAEALADC